MSSTSTVANEPELLDLRALSNLGYGTTASLRTSIHRGKVPAVRVGNRFKVRRDDLHYLSKAVAPAHPAGKEDLDALAKEIIDGFPPLTAEQKAELGQLLAAVG